MGRILYSLVVLSLVTTGCQKARMKSTPPKAQPTTNAQPPSQPPPPTWNPPPPPPPQHCSQTNSCPPPPPPSQPPVTPVTPPPPVTSNPPPNPVVPPTDTNVVVNPPVTQPGIPPKFQPPPAIVETPPPPVTCNGNCGTERIPLPPPKPIPVCGEGGPCPVIEPIAGRCDAVPFSGERKAGKLDIVFVVDTSASLRGGKTRNGGELAQIGRDIGNFVRELDKNTEYNIGVILGHGPATQHHGTLFRSNQGEPLVLKYEDYARAAGTNGTEEQIRARIEAAITRDLEKKMMNTANESRGAQGEAILLSLYTAVTGGQNAIKSAGLFRDDAALAVIMVTDEQDVCFDYTGTQYQPVAKGGRDSQGRPIEDPIEKNFREGVCARAVNGGPLRPNHVYDALMALKGEQKLVVTAIAYTDANIRPNPDLEDENERGHGVIELVGLFGSSPVVNLADVARSNGSVSFAPELKHLGQHTEMMMKYENPIKCTTRNIHPDAVDPATIRVTVKNGDGSTLGVFHGMCLTRACGRGTNGWAKGSTVRNGSNIYLEVLLQEAALKTIFSTARTENGTFNVEFRTKRGVDPRTGREGQGQAAAN